MPEPAWPGACRSAKEQAPLLALLSSQRVRYSAAPDAAKTSAGKFLGANPPAEAAAWTAVARALLALDESITKE